MKIKDIIEKVENTIMIVLLALQLIIVLTFTFARYTQTFRMPWGEEFSRYCMIWMVYIGVIIGAKSGAHFAVTAFDSIMPKWLHKIFVIIRIICVDAFCLFATYQATILMKKQMSTGQVSPALQWPMWTLYLAVPFGLFFMSIRYTIHNIKLMRGTAIDEEVQL